MKWIFVIVALALVILVSILPVKSMLGRRFLKQVKEDSLIVYGKKGHGKTLLFSEMTRCDKRTGYLSTTKFFHKGEKVIPYNAVNVYPNTWESVLNGDIQKIKKHKDWENRTVYLDDGAVFLPNFVDSDLKKRYPSLPVAYALWRHLYNAPIHINAQSVDRVYKLLREQADGFINCRGVMRFGPFAWVKCTYYSNINSAKQELCPMSRGVFNKFQRGEQAMYEATNGYIKDFIIFAPAWRNKYDSRYFHRVFFGKPYTYKTKRRKPKKKGFKNGKI